MVSCERLTPMHPPHDACVLLLQLRDQGLKPGRLGLPELSAIAVATALAPHTSIALVPAGDGSVRARAVRTSVVLPSPSHLGVAARRGSQAGALLPAPSTGSPRGSLVSPTAARL